ncbi:MAG: energy-coupling factor transporter transmembrane component T [Erysipelotrichaceae bacterium]
MKNFALGRYLPLDSLIHRMDPRAKICAMLIFVIAIFIPSGYYGYVIIGSSVLLCTLLAKLKLNFIWRAMKPMLFMLVFLLVINVLVVRTGYVVIALGSFKIYSDAISQTLYIVIRLMMMIVVTTILTATTKPLDMTLGIEDLLSPFKRFHVPAHEIAMIISIALRFIPTLIEETQRIMKAQSSRGVDLEEGSLFSKIKAILSLIIPLFLSAFQRADDLANAMEARGYNPGGTRTRYKVLKMHMRDYSLLVVCGLVLVSVGAVAVIGL